MQWFNRSNNKNSKMLVPSWSRFGPALLFSWPWGMSHEPWAMSHQASSIKHQAWSIKWQVSISINRYPIHRYIRYPMSGSQFWIQFWIQIQFWKPVLEASSGSQFWKPVLEAKAECRCRGGNRNAGAIFSEKRLLWARKITNKHDFCSFRVL